jgi:hypothetical protein
LDGAWRRRCVACQLGKDGAFRPIVALAAVDQVFEGRLHGKEFLGG